MHSNRVKQRALSGIQPTSNSYHLGNYLGAVKQWIDLQDQYDCLYFIPNLHAITAKQDPEELRSRTMPGVAQLLALGIDPEKSTLFLQSQVPQHAELAWVLTCITGYGEAARMTQFKDKSHRQGKDGTTVGLFSYPILMAADILLYSPELVPVGEDQKQHIELARTLAQRFNQTFGETFIVPTSLVPETTAKIYDLQDPGKKMSKSTSRKDGLVDLLDDIPTVRKKIRTAVTDGGSEIIYDPEGKPGISNLLAIQSSLTNKSIENIVESYHVNGSMYGHLKADTAGCLEEFLGVFQSRYRDYMSDPAEMQNILNKGREKAYTEAEKLMGTVYRRMGLSR